MEHGGIAGGGWLGRFLRVRERPAQSPLSAIALGKKFPECLRGAPSVTVMQSMDDFSLGPKAEDLVDGLARLYSVQQDLLAGAGRDTLSALSRIERMRTSVYRPEHGAEYLKDSFSLGLRQAAQLIKARVGLEAISLDLEGWDSHFTQSTIMNPLMVKLAGGLAAFYTDLGPAIGHTTVMVMTEFGRRVQENSSFGTDHGMGSVMLLMGGGIRGGRVIGKWPGLATDFDGSRRSSGGPQLSECAGADSFTPGRGTAIACYFSQLQAAAAGCVLIDSLVFDRGARTLACRVDTRVDAFSATSIVCAEVFDTYEARPIPAKVQSGLMRLHCAMTDLTASLKLYAVLAVSKEN